ncbi:MAG TPA: hypothetical protein VG370_06910 [Chloroflexota bacterium]|jgi:hypothetical protein|nr:hypothetical protein [Chloroflexota bacterium]
MLRVGTAAVDITPPVGTHLAGQFHDRIAEIIHDPLHARAMVIDDGATSAALVACDLLSLKRPTVVEVREIAAERTGVPAANVMIAATHTHTGPRTADIFPCPSDAEYLALLPRQIAGAVALAARAMQPGQIGVGSGREESASHNRRFLRADGTAQMHPPKGDPSFVGPEGPGDPEVGVLSARGVDGRFLGAIVNYASHPIVVGGERAISADYPGYLCRALRAATGHEGEVLFVNGAFADVCPVDVYDLKHREYGYAWAERVGHAIAGEALRVSAKADPMPSPRIRVASRRVELAIREIGEAQISEARSLLAQGEPTWRDEMTPDERFDYREKVYAREILLLAEERRRSPTVSAELQVVAVGDAAFVGIPGEFFVELGLEVKRRSPFLFTYIAGMANGCVGYIPTRRAFQGGGYETRLARSSKLVPEAGEQLADAAVGLLEQVSSASGERTGSPSP